MSNDSVVVALKERDVLGKAVRGLRRQGVVPAVIHDHGKPSIHVMAPYSELIKAYEAAGKHQPVELKVGNKKHLAMIKDVDFEPTKRQLRHVVFNAINQNEKVETDIAIVLAEAEIPAEKAGLMVLTQLTEVAVEALPNDLPEEFVVDPSGLTEVGDKLTVADLKVPEGVTVLTEPEQTIAYVEMPKDQIAEADAAAADLAADAAKDGVDVEATEEKQPSAEDEATEAKEEE